MIDKSTNTFGNHLAIWQIWHFLALFGIFWQSKINPKNFIIYLFIKLI